MDTIGIVFKDKSIDISTKTLGQNLPDLIKNRTFFYHPHPLYFLTIGKKTCFFFSYICISRE